MTERLTAEELAILRPIIESATGRLAWSAVEMRQMLATIDVLEAENKRLREALEWMQCRPHREGLFPQRNNFECTEACAVARAALEAHGD